MAGSGQPVAGDLIERVWARRGQRVGGVLFAVIAQGALGVVPGARIKFGQPVG